MNRLELGGFCGFCFALRILRGGGSRELDGCFRRLRLVWRERTEMREVKGVHDSLRSVGDGGFAGRQHRRESTERQVLKCS